MIAFLIATSLVLNSFPEEQERLSYKIPFYMVDKKPMLYLNILKGKHYVDVAFVHGVLFETDFPILKDDNKRKQVRSIQLKALEDLDQGNFIDLLQVAIVQTKKGRGWHL